MAWSPRRIFLLTFSLAQIACMFCKTGFFLNMLAGNLSLNHTKYFCQTKFILLAVYLPESRIRRHTFKFTYTHCPLLTSNCPNTLRLFPSYMSRKVRHRQHRKIAGRRQFRRTPLSQFGDHNKGRRCATPRASEMNSRFRTRTIRPDRSPEHIGLTPAMATLAFLIQIHINGFRYKNIRF